MITKVLHYCWFGKNEKSKVFLKCLDSWRDNCPDYEIIEWNEENSEQFSNHFYKNSLRKRKYAFVSDYIRSKVLYTYGGIYLDTDMLLIKPLESLLKYNFFSCYEVEGRVAYGLFGGEKKNHFFLKMLEFYNKTEFNEFNPPIITHTFKSLINNDNLRENEMLLDPSFFYPLKFQDREKNYEDYLTKNTIAVHLWEHSWKQPDNKSILIEFSKLFYIFVDFVFYNYSHNYFFTNSKAAVKAIYKEIKFNQI